MKKILRIFLSLTILLAGPGPANAETSGIPDYIKSLLILARSTPDGDDSTIEEEIEDEHIRRVGEMERDFLESAVDPESVDASATPPREELNKMPIKTFINSEPKYLTGLFARLLIFGRGKQLKQLITRAMHNLSLEGDSQDYKIRISGSPIPNASINQDKAFMTVNLGLVGDSDNEDELAYVIAHEMTHQNRQLLEVRKDSDEIESVLDQVNGYSGLDPAQREEIRADLGAVERLIKARYNPWAGYNFMKRYSKIMEISWDLKIMKLIYRWVFRRDFTYMEAHPVAEIRMAAMKAYILKRSREVDLSDLTQQYQNYQGVLKTLHLQMQMISKPLFSKWGQRGQQGLAFYEIWSLFFSESWAAHALGILVEPVKPVVQYAFAPLKSAFSTVGDLFSQMWSVIPSMPEQVTQNMPAGSTISGYFILGLSRGSSESEATKTRKFSTGFQFIG